MALRLIWALLRIIPYLIDANVAAQSDLHSKKTFFVTFVNVLESQQEFWIHSKFAISA